MATEYKLSYTASEIDRKLGEIDNLNSLSDRVDAVEQDLSEAVELVNDFNADLGDINNRVGVLENADTDVVNSVNGMTGAVTLAASDVGALPNTTQIPSSLSDLTADSTHRTVTDTEKSAWNAKANAADIPTKVSELTNDKGYITSAPVASVNGKTGTVVLSASDVGALPSTTTIPDALADLSTDSTHRVVTDTEKSTWNAKANTSDIPTKVSQLTNDSKFITSYTETDPTVPSWAKASSKPSYTKSEVGLGNVDNVKQYSASNPPPYPVTKVNNKTGTVTLSASDVGADASGTASSAVSAHNTNTSAHADIRAEISQLSSEIVDIKAESLQQAPLYANSIEECTDTDKMYVLPDGFLYAYMLTQTEVEGGGGYTNALDGTTKNINQRWSHSGKKLSASSGYMTTDKLPVTADKIVYVNLPRTAFLGNYARIHYFDASGNYVNAQDGTAAQAYVLTTDAEGVTSWKVGYENATFNDASTNKRLANADNITHMVIVFNVTSVVYGNGDTAITAADVADIIVSIGNPIEEGGTEIVTEYAWVSTGHAFVPADYEDRIVDLENKITSLENKNGTSNNTGVGTSYTNLLPLAINADGTPYVGNNREKGYKTGYRLNSSAVETEASGRCCTGFIPVKHTDTVRFKNIYTPADGNKNGYIHFYTSTFTRATGIAYELWTSGSYEFVPSQLKSLYESNGDAGSDVAYMRISSGVISENSIITVNEEIVDSAVDSPNDSNEVIKNWDAPIYDAHIPVFQLSTEKAAMTNATNTPANIYAKYDALMAKHPRYITKTDLGLCSDGVNHVYRYDFREPEPLHESNKAWSETKAKAIIVTGIHYEWAGIYAMYNALEEITNNPELRNFRRNTHLIVVPVANPYATIASNYQSGLSTPNSYGVRNANGVEIHRNFEVDWALTDEGSTHYGGAAPLSEVETQYIDNIMKNNTDAAVFLSCHNCGVDTFWGTGFIWSSTATKYMCNMGYRLVDKMSDAWMDKYGDTLTTGIAEYKTDLLEEGDTRLGFAGLSTTAGTEAKQATKYGIQGTNVEICDPFQIHGTKASPEPSMSSFTMSRGAEVYANFLLTALGVYDHKDKKEYAPSLQ